MNYESFIKELKRTPGLEPLHADSQGVYSLRINHEHLVQLSESSDGESLFISGPVFPVPTGDEEKLALWDRLLTSNLFAKGTRHGWFAKDPKSHQVLLIFRLTISQVTVSQFLNELQLFVDYLIHWKQELNQSAREQHDHYRRHHKRASAKDFHLKV